MYYSETNEEAGIFIDVHYLSYLLNSFHDPTIDFLTVEKVNVRCSSRILIDALKNNVAVLKLEFDMCRQTT